MHCAEHSMEKIKMGYYSRTDLCGVGGPTWPNECCGLDYILSISAAVAPTKPEDPWAKFKLDRIPQGHS